MRSWYLFGFLVISFDEQPGCTRVPILGQESFPPCTFIHATAIESLLFQIYFTALQLHVMDKSN